MRKLSMIIILFCSVIFAAGCTANAEVDEEDHAIAIVSPVHDSIHEQTFEELGLGKLWTYHLKLPDASNSWVRIWVEWYRNGQLQDQRTVELSYGLSPKQVEEGMFGIGLMNLQENSKALTMYSIGVSLHPRVIPELLASEGILGSVPFYAVNGEVKLEAGEALLLGGYRATAGVIETLDVQNPEAITKMIEGDIELLLFKIVVDHAESVLDQHPPSE